LDSGYSFFNIDYSFDYLLSIGIRPIVEISFMPELLASGNYTVFHYQGNITPPKNWTDWQNLVKALVGHFVDRYGVDEVQNWRFEVWNEPNCGFYYEPNCCGTGCGSQQQYFELYANTATAVKSVSSQLLVGGPATAQLQWINEFIDFVNIKKVPADFVSSHLYPADPEVEQNRAGFVRYLTEGAQKAAAGGLPLLLTEYNGGLGINASDGPYASSFVTYLASAMQTIPNLELFSYWTFSDIFEEQGFDSTPYNQKFGMETIYHIPKPSYRAFELLHRLGDQAFPMTASENSTVTAYAITAEGSAHFDIMLSNYNYYNHPIFAHTVTVTLNNAPSLNVNASLRRIDDIHANGENAWIAAGSPMYPNLLQVNEMLLASQVRVEPITLTISGVNQYEFAITVPAYGVACITIDLAFPDLFFH